MLPLRDLNPTGRTAWVTVGIIAVCVGVFFLVQPADTSVPATVRFNYEHAAIPCELRSGEPLAVDEINAALAGLSDTACDLAPEGREAFPDKQVYLAVLISMFLHGGFAHLAFNMLYLWIFGNNVEDRLGRGRYVLLYVAAGVVATLAQTMIEPDSTIPMVGASGAIAGTMGAYLVWFPRVPIMSLFAFFVVPVRAMWLLGFWFVSQFFIGPDEGVAWAAHVGGFVFGAVVALAVRTSRGARQVVWRQPDW